MIELEIQTLSQTREGLLIEVGRAVTASGFTLIRQRLSDDPHGILMSMVVRGPPRRQRVLEIALEEFDRIISFEVSPFVAGEAKPHFAASRRISGAPARPVPIAPRPPVAQGPAPVVAAPKAPAVPAPVMSDLVTAAPPAPTTDPRTVASTPPVATLPDEPWLAELPPDRPPMPASPAPTPAPEHAFEPEPLLDFDPPTPAAPAMPPAAAPAPFVEITPLAPDALAVDEVLVGLPRDYPRIIPRLLAMDGKAEPGARESSLALAGRRVGDWVYQRDYATNAQLDLPQAIAAIAIPALSALVEVQQRGMQIHIHHSPLCTQDDHSGCSFYSGFLEGLLGPALASEVPTIFPVCCRSYGADDCVLDLSD